MTNPASRDLAVGLQMFRMRAGAGLGDRDRRADLACRDARQPCRALVRVGKAADEKPRRHLPRGKRAGQPQQSGFRGNRLFGGGDRADSCRAPASAPGRPIWNRPAFAIAPNGSARMSSFAIDHQ